MLFENELERWSQRLLSCIFPAINPANNSGGPFRTCPRYLEAPPLLKLPEAEGSTGHGVQYERHRSAVGKFCRHIAGPCGSGPFSEGKIHGIGKFPQETFA